MSNFQARLLSFETLTGFEEAWLPADFVALLEAAEFSGIDTIAEEDLREMCLMALQDLEPPEAALLVLRHRLGDRLRRGQLNNLAHELSDEKHWEHYADMALHEDIFHASSLMWSVFPQRYPRPDAHRIALRVEPLDAPARELLASGLEESALVRLVAGGMSDRSLLCRLFEDQLAGERFSCPSAIIWTFQVTPDGDGVRILLTGSSAWLGPLKGAAPWSCEARPDPELEED